MSEPEGTLLEKNDPETGRWYARDVVALSTDAGLSDIAPYFLDQNSDSSEWPRAGLTHVAFRNPHLSYALTWYSMALLLAGAFGWQIFRRNQKDLA